MKKSTIRIAAWLLLAASAITCMPAIAAFPERPIRIVIPFPPGGGSDTLARIIAPKLSERWGQPVIVENKPGADTQIGTEALVRAAPDGYTVGIFVPSVLMNKFIYPNPNYDVSRDLQPVAMLITVPSILAVNPKLSAKTLPELIALAKAKPGGLNYSTASSSSAVSMAYFNQSVGIKATQIPYKGSAASVQGTITGETHYVMDNVGTIKPHLDSGRLRPLGINTSQRQAEFPDLPTLTEGGAAGFGYQTWFGMFAPAGVPKEIVAKYNKDVAEILASPDIRPKLQAMSATHSPMNVEAFAESLKQSTARFGELIRSLGLAKN